MAQVQQVFRRREIKYCLDEKTFAAVKAAMLPHLVPDTYANYSIFNEYCDTKDYDLIAKSVEKPAFKQKLRIRSYGTANPDDPVFLELKKKYAGVVYKRRITLTLAEAENAVLSGRLPARFIGGNKQIIDTSPPVFAEIAGTGGQNEVQQRRDISSVPKIGGGAPFFPGNAKNTAPQNLGKQAENGILRASFVSARPPLPEDPNAAELAGFLSQRKIEKRTFLAYDREAYRVANDEDLRVTFDTNLRFRTENVSLSFGGEGRAFDTAPAAILEIKAQDAFPLWMTEILTKERIYPSSFSKYGCLYERGLLQ